MTSKSRTGDRKRITSAKRKPGRPRQPRETETGRWHLQEAKARFSELVRRVKTEGPQLVSVHGRDEVVVVAAEEFRRLQGDATGQRLIDALQASPHRDVDIAPSRAPARVRDVQL